MTERDCSTSTVALNGQSSTIQMCNGSAGSVKTSANQLNTVTSNDVNSDSSNSTGKSVIVMNGGGTTNNSIINNNNSTSSPTTSSTVVTQQQTSATAPAGATSSPVSTATTNTSKSKGPIRVGFYDIERTIGKGNFAVVKLARHRITKSEVSLSLTSFLSIFRVGKERKWNVWVLCLFFCFSVGLKLLFTESSS